MDPAQFNELMRLYAQDAVLVASKRFGVQLDFTPESLDAVDRILQQLANVPKAEFVAGLRPLGPDIDDDELWVASKMWGGYVGEVFLRSWPGAWSPKPADDGSVQVVLEFANGCKCFPCETVWRILSGEPFKAVASVFRGIAALTGDGERHGVRMVSAADAIAAGKPRRPWWKFWSRQ